MKLYSVLEEGFVRESGGWPWSFVHGNWQLCVCVGKSEGLFESGFRGLFFARLM